MGAPADIPTQGFLNSVKSIAAVRGRLSALMQSLITWQDLILEARELVQDTGNNDCPIRYPDAMMLNALNRGLQELARIRPDAFYDKYDSNSLNVPEIADTVIVNTVIWTDNFDLDRKFWVPLVHYIQGSVWLSEDEYNRGQDGNPHSSRAAGALRLFRKHVLSV